MTIISIQKSYNVLIYYNNQTNTKNLWSILVLPVNIEISNTALQAVTVFVAMVSRNNIGDQNCQEGH